MKKPSQVEFRELGRAYSQNMTTSKARYERTRIALTVFFEATNLIYESTH